jgi:peptide/nickel transport system substrate-binding protein
MEESELRGLIARVKTGRLSRRGFVRRMLTVGLSVPMATQLLAIAGVATAQTRSDYAPTKRPWSGHRKLRRFAMWDNAAPKPVTVGRLNGR